MIQINKELLKEVSLSAQNSSRKRKNYNFHKKTSDPLQRMLNALEPGTYIRPHKHENPDKREVFILLKGKVAVVEFDLNGNIIESAVLNHESGIYAIEIQPKIYHTIISLESGSVVYEIKDGPYDVSNDKGFAPWAPEEGSKNAEIYLIKIINESGLGL